MTTNYGERPGLTVDGDAHSLCAEMLRDIAAERDAARADAARLRAACDEARALLSEAKRRGPCVDAAWCKLYDATEAGKDGAR